MSVSARRALAWSSCAARSSSDGGHCVECGGAFDLQCDHILPVAHGGATTLENLQLLCADRNRRKSDSI